MESPVTIESTDFEVIEDGDEENKQQDLFPQTVKKEVVPNPPFVQEFKNRYVTKSYELAVSWYDFTATELKVLAACISAIDPMRKYTEEEIKAGIEVKFTDEELLMILNTTRKSLLTYVDRIAKNFHSKPIRHPAPKESQKKINYINVALNSYWDDETKEFVFIFHPIMLTHLVDLERYITYNLPTFLLLNSKFSQRLYEIALTFYNVCHGMMNDDNEVVAKIPMNEFYFKLGLIGSMTETLKKYGGDYSIVKSRVILPAIEECNTNPLAEFLIEMKEYRVGRKYGGVTLKMTPNNTEESVKQREIIKIAKPLGLAKVTIASLIKKYSTYQVFLAVKYMTEIMEDSNEGKIKNKKAYFEKLVKYRIAELPEVANPYDSKYKKIESELKEFVENYIIEIWFELPEELRAAIEKSESFQKHDLTSEIAKAFASDFKATSKLFSPKEVLEEWTEAWNGKRAEDPTYTGWF